jgi:two-component system, NarL family, response regulator DegU
MIRVVVADDHRLVRQMFRSTLSCEDDMAIVAEAECGNSAIEVTQKSRPDVLILDMNLPDKSGLEVIRTLKPDMSDLKILVLTAVEKENVLFEALAAGAQGYLLKDSDVEEVLAAIRDLHQGRGHLHARSTMSLLNEFQRTRMEANTLVASEPQEVKEILTPREVEVLELVGYGYSNSDIGEKLFISERTVKTHVSNILRRLELKSRISAATYAVRQGLCREPAKYENR